MVVHYSLIFPWDGRNKDFSVAVAAYNDIKIVILHHSKQEVPYLYRGVETTNTCSSFSQGMGPIYATDLLQISGWDFTF